VGFVWRVLKRHGVPEREIEDACQEVFVVVHRRADTFEGRSQLRSWLYGIALRVALAFRRKAHVRREQLGAEGHDASAEPEQERAVEQQQDLSFLQAVLLELDAEKREAFVLYELEGMNVAELAAATEVPEGTALYRLHQARDEVKRRSRRAQLSDTRSGTAAQRAARGGA
jgi:RNA polymerase sigma-70 factor (ECF subfamily)